MIISYPERAPLLLKSTYNICLGSHPDTIDQANLGLFLYQTQWNAEVYCEIIAISMLGASLVRK